MNLSKVRSPVQWAKWRRSGAVGTIEHATTAQDRYDRKLLATAVMKRSPHVARYFAEQTILRIGRWGTCVCCPDMSGNTYPQRGKPMTEFCPETGRYDHHIDWTRGGKFYFDYKEVTRDFLEAFVAS